MSTIALTDHRFDRGTTYQSGRRHLAVVPAPSQSAPLRLTRRGRALVLLLALAAISVAVVLFGSSTAATDSSAPIGTTTITVQPGQTLWGIAAAANPDGDVRDTVDAIIKLNALTSASALQMGAELAVPVYE